MVAGLLRLSRGAVVRRAVLHPARAVAVPFAHRRDYQRLAIMRSTTRLIPTAVAGAIPGVILGYLIARIRLAEQILYPLVVFIQGLPKIRWRR